MTPSETASTLRQFNEWRRGDYEPSEQPEPPDPREIGEAIDSAIEMIERLEAAEKERDALRAAMRHEADCVDAAKAEIDALHAKIEAMEKQEPIWFIDERGEPQKYHKSKADYCKYGGLDLLYALPGAKGE